MLHAPCQAEFRRSEKRSVSCFHLLQQEVPDCRLLQFFSEIAAVFPKLLRLSRRVQASLASSSGNISCTSPLGHHALQFIFVFIYVYNHSTLVQKSFFFSFSTDRTASTLISVAAAVIYKLQQFLLRWFFRVAQTKRPSRLPAFLCKMKKRKNQAAKCRNPKKTEEEIKNAR